MQLETETKFDFKVNVFLFPRHLVCDVDFKS